MTRPFFPRELLLALFFLLLAPLPAARADDGLPATDPTVQQSGDFVRADKNVAIPPPRSDAAIANRLKRIFATTGWFQHLQVTSQEGVVTIAGKVSENSQRDWAVNLAQDGDGVVAVIDKISIQEAPWFDLRPTRKEVASIWKSFFAFIPHLVIALTFLALSIFVYRWVSRFSRRFWARRLPHPVLADVMGKLGALPVLLIGFYLILQVLGLTGLAFTLLGGTGALGLVAGFAFNNILQNYFSGIILSLWKPFLVGDVIEVANQKGVVYRMTTRGTTLVDFDGNHIMIPNSTIFTNIIKNHTASPFTRVRLAVPLAPDVPVEQQKKLALDYLQSHPEVEKKPAAEALTDGSGGDQMLEIYFWINVHENSAEKIRNVFGDELRALLRGDAPREKADAPSTKSEAKDLLRQAARDPSVDQGRNLLRESRP